MSESWINALNSYSYHTYLNTFERANKFPGFFEKEISGDRNSTIEFENYYQKMAPKNIEVFYEVIYWKLYSQGNRRQQGTNRIIDFISTQKIRPEQLWDSIHCFIEDSSILNLKKVRSLLGISTKVLAVTLTLPALASPKTIPMIDIQVARWVNHNCEKHNENSNNKLSIFHLNYTSLQDNDFPNYLSWVAWCQEIAQKLTKRTDLEWRARDVEMAVFTAQRNEISLEVIS